MFKLLINCNSRYVPILHTFLEQTLLLFVRIENIIHISCSDECKISAAQDQPLGGLSWASLFDYV